MEEEEIVPNELRCHRMNSNWRCKNPKLNGRAYCEHHSRLLAAYKNKVKKKKKVAKTRRGRSSCVVPVVDDDDDDDDYDDDDDDDDEEEEEETEISNDETDASTWISDETEEEEEESKSSDNDEDEETENESNNARRETISFWDDKWCGEKTLKEEFPMLYHVSTNQFGSIQSHIYRDDGEKASWNLGFTRNFKGWEMDLVRSLLERIGEPPRVGVGNDSRHRKRNRVHMVRGFRMDRTDEFIGLENVDSLQKQIEPCKHTKMSERTAERHCKTFPSSSLDQTVGKSRNCREEVGSNTLESIKLLRTAVELKDIKNLESFNIAVHGLVIDSELSEQARRTYYELCCSQNAFLHENLIETINSKMAAGLISQTINIADAIRASKLSTSLDEFAEWEMSLGVFEQLGMNVGFLRAWIKKLVRLVHESKDGVDSKRYGEVIDGIDDVKQEISILKVKLIELKEACKWFDTEIENLEVKAKHCESKFQAEVDTLW